MQYRFRKFHLLVVLATFLVGVATFKTARTLTSLLDRVTNAPVTLIAPVTDHHQDEIDVYHAVLQGCRETEQPYVVQGTTVNGWDVEKDQEGIAGLQRSSGVSAETINDYISNSKTKRDLTHDDLGIDWTLIPDASVESYFNDGGGGWREFYKDHRHSSGLLSLSRIGFNRTRDEAIVYVATQCDWLCGVGSFVILKKEGAIWREKMTLPIWVS
jgi:hypothetical protein